MTCETPAAIVATGGIGSRWHTHRGLLETLALAGRRALIVDAGGLCGNTGYFRLGRGAVERQVLAKLYDAFLPSGVGFGLYTDPVLSARCVCSNLDRLGQAVFRPALSIDVGGVETLILGVLGRCAFEQIPAAERAGLTWRPPGEAVRARLARTEHSRPRPLLVLSHGDPGETEEIAEACSGATSVIVSATPLDEPWLPACSGATVLHTHGTALGQRLQPFVDRWETQVEPFPQTVPGPGYRRLRPLHAEIRTLTAQIPASPVPADGAGTDPAARTGPDTGRRPEHGRGDGTGGGYGVGGVSVLSAQGGAGSTPAGADPAPRAAQC